MNFLGVLPYRRGGNSAERGFDCSGFTATCSRPAWAWCCRAVDEQTRASADQVKRDELRPGDLVFFSTLKAQLLASASTSARAGSSIRRAPAAKCASGHALRYWSKALHGRAAPRAAAGGRGRRAGRRSRRRLPRCSRQRPARPRRRTPKPTARCTEPGARSTSGPAGVIAGSPCGPRRHNSAPWAKKIIPLADHRYAASIPRIPERFHSADRPCRAAYRGLDGLARPARSAHLGRRPLQSSAAAAGHAQGSVRQAVRLLPPLDPLLSCGRSPAWRDLLRRARCAMKLRLTGGELLLLRKRSGAPGRHAGRGCAARTARRSDLTASPPAGSLLARKARTLKGGRACWRVTVGLDALERRPSSAA